MAAQLPSDDGASIPRAVLHQAQAAAAAQNPSTIPARQDATVHDIDLITPDAAEDDMPPPAYGESYGEICNEEDGLGTSAKITNDGRVNIRINHLNRRLSQIFKPALRQQTESVHDSHGPPPPYIPSSLGGKPGIPPPPPLNVVIHVVGSRGDVQPFVALGKVLKNTYGHRIRLATHPNFKDFVQDNGLEFFSIGGDPSRLMAFMVNNGPGLMPGFRSLVSGDVGRRRRDVAEYIQGCWRSCYKAGEGMEAGSLKDDFSEPAKRPFVADCIIANPPSFAHIHCAEKLGIPLHIMFTMPYSPTQAFPHPLANVQSNADPQVTNYVSYVMIELLSWQGLGDIINRFRAKCLGLDPVSLTSAPGMLQRLKIPHTYCWSPALIPKPKDWGPHISISGFYFLKSNYTPSPELQAFLDAGPPPVYIGFGSIVLDDPDALTELILAAAKTTGQRILLSKGWGGVGAGTTPDGVFMLGNVPHDWLFKHVSCIIHHGGAGTTAAGIAAGRPTVVVPFFGDQPFWGAMVARAGAGPDPIPYKQLTADRLASAIEFCLRPETLERARELGSKITAEKGSGSEMGAQSFHQHLDVNSLRCTLAPSRPAAWRIKRTKVQLSAFAACTLANANLLDFHDLKLFRPREYPTDEGPSDPLSAFATGVFRAFGGMALGVAESPSETLRALSAPFGPRRQQSKVSVSTSAKRSKSSSLEARSAPPTPLDSSRQSQTSLNLQRSLTSGQNPAKGAELSILDSNIRPNSSLDASPEEVSREADNTSQSRIRSRKEFSSSKEHDMLRQSAAHSSKGFGRLVKTAVLAPMEISVGITKGFHNLPKAWGDDTVRPHEPVTGLKSGFQAVGKEFGFGMYDGVTGVFTQPWKGAQREGATGFAKGIGRGVGGLLAKPGAALWGIPSHFMKGATKEVEKLFGTSVQSYIVASRTAQGYEEWLQSSEAEKQDVVDGWRLIQRLLKKKEREPDEVARHVLGAQRKVRLQDRESEQSNGRTLSSAPAANDPDARTQSPESAMLTIRSAHSISQLTNTTSEESLLATKPDESMPAPVPETSPGESDGESDVFGAIRHNVSQLQRQRQEAADDQVAQKTLRHAIHASGAEAQRHVDEALEYEAELKQALAQSLREQRFSANDSHHDFDGREGSYFELVGERSQRKAETAAVAAQRSPSYYLDHLAGTTQADFEKQEQQYRGEKTAQEKTEEGIVMAYVKKQSLLEGIHHRNKGKGRVTETDDSDDLQQALELSMQGRTDRYGKASGA